MSLIRYLASSILCALTLIVGSAVVAEPAEPMVYVVSTFDVKPGYEAQFEEFVLAWKKAAEQVEAARSYNVSSTAVGPSGVYSFARRIRSFTEMGTAVNPLTKVYEADEVSRLMALYRDSTANARSFIARMVPDLSRPAPARDTPYQIAIYYSFDIKPGMADEWASAVRKLVEATEKSAPEAYFSTWTTTLGGDSGYTVIVPMDWADLDTPKKPIPQRLEEVFGKRVADRTIAALNRASNGVTSVIMRPRPELAIPTKQ